MRTKTVKRHWCDFCNRAGLQAHAMAKHERHCTMNPARACRACRLIHGGNGPDAEGLRALVAILPSNVPVEFDANCNWTKEYEEFTQAIAAATPKLREASDGCPACMLAAIRQAGIPVPLVDFDFKAEMAEIISAYAAEHMDVGYY
jgi:hypothetical protein